MLYTSLTWPDPFRAAAYRLEIISTALQGTYNFQSISGCAERVWPRETSSIESSNSARNLFRYNVTQGEQCGARCQCSQCCTI